MTCDVLRNRKIWKCSELLGIWRRLVVKWAVEWQGSRMIEFSFAYKDLTIDSFWLFSSFMVKKSSFPTRMAFLLTTSSLVLNTHNVVGLLVVVAVRFYLHVCIYGIPYLQQWKYFGLQPAWVKQWASVQALNSFPVRVGDSKVSNFWRTMYAHT
jgi:hypothetical protein